MPVKKLKEYLSQNNVKFTSIPHSLAYSAKEVSHVCHIPEKELAKTVIVYAGTKLIMVVLPSSDAVDFKSLKESIHENDVTLASENDFLKKFPDCELGAMPPFGNLYDMEVYIDKKLTDNPEIAFNAGTHTEVIRLAFKDFEKLVHPKVINAVH